MPSPFPGMDPFIESQAWSDFRSRLVTEISFALVPRIHPRYVVRIEERMYIEHVPNGHLLCIRPDVTVLEPAGHKAPAAGAGAAAPVGDGHARRAHPAAA